MHSLQTIHAIRRHVPLLAGSLVLTQVPALALLILGEPQRALAWVGYGLGSVLAAGGLFAVAVVWSSRLERVVALVRGYAEHGNLPKVERQGGNGSVETVQASLASLAHAVRCLEEDATRDPLTGTFNRRCCATRMETDLARCHRSGTAFSVAVFDLDDLKTLNDRHGHAAGDTALRHLARILHECVREGDWVARWGGDEFLVGLWNADGASAVVAVQRVFDCLATTPIEIDAGKSTLSASVGVAQAEAGDDASGLFCRADGALLQAKRAGRARVHLA